MDLRLGRICEFGMCLAMKAGLCTGVLLSSCAPQPRDACAARSDAIEEDATPESLPDFALRWLFGIGMGRKLHIGKMQLYYVDPVTELQAQATGQFLRRLGFARDAEQQEALVQLRKNTESTPPFYELRIGTRYTRKEHIDLETRSVYQLMALSAEGALFEGAPVQIYLCNSLLQPLLILRPRLQPQPASSAAPFSVR